MGAELCVAMCAGRDSEIYTKSGTEMCLEHWKLGLRASRLGVAAGTVPNRVVYQSDLSRAYHSIELSQINRIKRKPISRAGAIAEQLTKIFD